MVGGKKLENSLQQWLTIGATAVVLVGGVFFIFPSIPAALGLSSTPGLGVNPAQVTASGGGCNSNGQTDLDFKASYYDVSSLVDTLVATTVAIYGPGETTAMFSTSSNASAYATIGSVNCNTKGLVAYIGDHGATYYEVKKVFDGQNAASTQTAISLKKAAAATATFSNTTNLGQSTVGVVSGSGSTVTDVVMKLKAGQYYYGDGAQEICAQFTQNNISKVYFNFNGQTLAELPADPTISVTAGNLLKCYELTGDINNYVSKDIGVVIQAATGVTPAYSNITITLNDKASYLKNGQLIFGYWNADTNADVGLGKVTKTTAISVNPT